MSVITSKDPITQVSVDTTAESRYNTLAKDRESYLQRAREAAAVTIPALGPPEGKQSSKDQRLPDPFQSTGSRGVNSLASKLLLALLPPGSPFFKLGLDDFVLNELAQSSGLGGEDPRAAFEEALATVERAITTRIEQINVRATLFETLKQLLVAGNALPYLLPKKGGLRLFRINEYVLKRDPSGRVLEIITQQMLSLSALPERISSMVEIPGPDAESKDKSTEDTIGLYTRIQRSGNHWEVHQEVNGKIVPNSEGTFPIDHLPWIPLRFTRIDNEDYGRGFVDDYLGDLKSLDSLSQSIVEGAAAAAKVLMFVNEGGTTDKKEVSEAENLDVIEGDARDVTILQLDKFADFQVAQKAIDDIKRDLKEAFLLFSSVTRNAERVTAEEIRLLAGELEDTLGGIYSLLTQELQLPLVTVVMAQLTKEGRLPALPKDVVTPQIITGLEALGRGQDLRKIDALMQGIVTFFGPDEVSKYVKAGSFIKRRGTALNIDLDGLIRTEEEVQAIVEAQQQAAAQQALGPEGLKQTGAIVRDELERNSGGK